MKFLSILLLCLGFVTNALYSSTLYDDCVANILKNYCEGNVRGCIEQIVKLCGQPY